MSASQSKSAKKTEQEVKQLFSYNLKDGTIIEAYEILKTGHPLGWPGHEKGTYRSNVALEGAKQILAEKDLNLPTYQKSFTILDANLEIKNKLVGKAFWIYGVGISGEQKEYVTHFAGRRIVQYEGTIRAWNDKNGELYGATGREDNPEKLVYTWPGEGARLFEVNDIGDDRHRPPRFSIRADCESSSERANVVVGIKLLRPTLVERAKDRVQEL